MLQNELFSDVKERLQKRLDVPPKEWEKFRFALVVLGRTLYLPEEDDYRVVLREFVPHSVQGTVNNLTHHNL